MGPQRIEKNQGISAPFRQEMETYQLIHPRYALINVDRTPKQIRERYLNYLRPHLSQERWTEEEDELLLELIQKYGHSWKAIEKHMSKRSQNQLKNRYYGKLKKTNP